MSAECPWGPGPSALADFCELPRCSLVQQPVSALSAAAFLLAAMGIWRLAHQHRQPALWLLAVGSVLTGIGTAAFHASGTFTSQMLDHVGMQATNVAMVLLCTRRWLAPSWRTLYAWGAALMLALFIGMIAWHDLKRALYVGGMLPCALIEARLFCRDRATTRYRALAAAWLLFGLAVAAWFLDRSAAVCDPRSPLQLHALWHALCAVGLWVMAAYYVQFDALRPR